MSDCHFIGIATEGNEIEFRSMKIVFLPINQCQKKLHLAHNHGSRKSLKSGNLPKTQGPISPRQMGFGIFGQIER